MLVLMDSKAKTVQHYLFKSVLDLTIQTVCDGAIYLQCRTTQSKQSILELLPNSHFVNSKLGDFEPRTRFKLIGFLRLSPLWEPCPA